MLPLKTGTFKNIFVSLTRASSHWSFTKRHYQAVYDHPNLPLKTAELQEKNIYILIHWYITLRFFPTTQWPYLGDLVFILSNVKFYILLSLENFCLKTMYFFLTLICCATSTKTWLYYCIIWGRKNVSAGLVCVYIAKNVFSLFKYSREVLKPLSGFFLCPAGEISIDFLFWRHNKVWEELSLK